jgi:Methylase involved in ubiquinone/menaquinone biosynthesis
MTDEDPDGDGEASNGEAGGDHPADGATLDTHRAPARVREIYNRIAPHFSKTRAYPWPEVERFLAETGEDGLHRVGLDVGCGNGRHTDPLGEQVETVVGIDVSRGLLTEARARMSASSAGTVALVEGDAAAVPLGAGVVDIAVYVATIHHLPDRESRVESLSELSRVLRPGGRALVSAWSTAHDRFDASAEAGEGFDTTIDWTLPGGETVPRFYHIYAPAEFERDLRDGGLVVESAVVSSGNCYAEVRPDR